jgi:hypothetical protein
VLAPGVQRHARSGHSCTAAPVVGLVILGALFAFALWLDRLTGWF